MSSVLIPKEIEHSFLATLEPHPRRALQRGLTVLKAKKMESLLEEKDPPL
jgi:hypothetical protein